MSSLRKSVMTPLLLAMLGGGIVALPLRAHAADVVYDYDVRGRLISATYPNGVKITYHYDAAGNRTSVIVTPPVLRKNSIVALGVASCRNYGIIAAC